MFSSITNEISERFLATQMHFDATCTPGFHQHVAISKGLAFISIYGNYEYTVRNVVAEAIRHIKQSAIQYQHIKIEILPLLLHSELNSVAGAGGKTAWKKRVELFRQVNAAVACCTSDDAFPSDGSHYRISQIYAIWEAFGITSPVIPNPQWTPLIGEVVENRNAIAHGRRTSRDVGRGYTKDDIVTKFERMRDICLYIVSTVETHVTHAPNIRR
jgi:hypothetical protein